MNHFKEIIARIRANPAEPTNRVLHDLIVALDSGRHFDLQTLFDLGVHDFDLAMGLLRDWRIVSYIHPRGTWTQILESDVSKVPDLVD